MQYCWEVYNKSECEICGYYKAFNEGKLDIEKNREIIVVEEAN